MYFTKNNNFYHGIMFHYFHDNEIHKKGQGSIDKDDFYKVINFIGRKNILNADEFFEKIKNNKIKNTDVCFTFDDGIKCQLDIALPILEDLKIKSYFFTYTSMFEKKPDNLDVFKYFRTNYFNNINEFYDNFYKRLDFDLSDFFNKNLSEIKYRKYKYNFYSIEDIKFRLVRNDFLNKKEYEQIMFSMIEEKKINLKDVYKKLFITKYDLQKLDNLGHVIGLHTHTHPTQIENFSYDEQKNEYEKSLSLISHILNKPKNEIKCMSHPCGSYNNDTLEILKGLGIELGFKNVMMIEKEKKMKKINNSYLEIARQNYSDILSEMRILRQL